MSRQVQQATVSPTSPLAWVLLKLIGVYQRWLSPLLGTNCRFYPSCSQYTREAICTHGALAGATLGALRICRCNPLCEGGFDPVPTSFPLGFKQKLND
ncbi:MAG TPA: membrane protein insertion efficiency factor YidD [Hyphomicrobiales bacterium]|nr:membrane protein insertion efficiency factor YidD [Hyphomicrobiales bacterium]